MYIDDEIRMEFPAKFVVGCFSVPIRHDGIY